MDENIAIHIQYYIHLRSCLPLYKRVHHGSNISAVCKRPDILSDTITMTLEIREIW